MVGGVLCSFLIYSGGVSLGFAYITDLLVCQHWSEVLGCAFHLANFPSRSRPPGSQAAGHLLTDPTLLLGAGCWQGEDALFLLRSHMETGSKIESRSRPGVWRPGLGRAWVTLTPFGRLAEVPRPAHIQWLGNRLISRGAGTAGKLCGH